MREDVGISFVIPTYRAVVGAVMRKLAHLIYGVIKSERPFDANFNHSALAIQDGIWPRVRGSLSACKIQW